MFLHSVSESVIPQAFAFDGTAFQNCSNASSFGLASDILYQSYINSVHPDYTNQLWVVSSKYVYSVDASFTYFGIRLGQEEIAPETERHVHIAWSFTNVRYVSYLNLNKFAESASGKSVVVESTLWMLHLNE